MSGDNEMVERVARALIDAWLPPGRGAQRVSGDVVVDDQWRHQARAIIAAMRDPDHRMVERGGITIGSKEFEHIRSDPTGYGVMHAAEMVWRAMIDAILQGDRR